MIYYFIFGFFFLIYLRYKKEERIVIGDLFLAMLGSLMWPMIVLLFCVAFVDDNDFLNIEIHTIPGRIVEYFEE